MKKINFLFLLSLILLAPISVYAENTCPPKNILYAQKFIDGRILEQNGFQNSWEFTSNDFNYNKKNWKIIYGVKLSPIIINKEMALSTANNIFKYETLLDYPLVQTIDEVIYCWYNQHWNIKAMTI